MNYEEAELAERRWNDLELLQKHYAKFEDFLYDVMTDLLHYQCTDLQIDIGDFLENGPSYKMVQAQRGQAKTTITAIYAVWRIIHEPRLRVLIVSAGSDLASEIANWIIQIVMNMPELECLRPDTTHGDRSSVKAFDIHWHLRGPEKSPSVACVGITSNLQGKRADLLIADDIESSKNSRTATQRELLKQLTRDFTSICSTGDIVYLGTPQSVDSVYNSLPSRGFTVRIWPGRYPTAKELQNYDKFLAPLLQERIKNDCSLQTGGGPLGDRGKPTDPILLPEDKLIAKEIDQGPSYFQLQHMLDTRLMDEDRYPLKPSSIVFMDVPAERAPVLVNWAAIQDMRIYPPQGYPLSEAYYRAMGFGTEFGHYSGTHMYVDPAGGGANGDELAYAVTKFLGGNIYVVDAGGIPGGYSEDKLRFLTSIAVRWKPNVISVERNYGNGAFWQIWQPHLQKALKEVNHTAGIEEVWESGQKELRIIDILEPVISSNRLIMDADLIKRDWEMVQRYPAEQKAVFSLLFQIARITRDKGSLIHDDRVDALAGSVRHWVEALAQDKEKVAAKIKNDNYQKMVTNPLGSGRKLKLFGNSVTPNAFNKFLRRE